MSESKQGGLNLGCEEKALRELTDKITSVLEVDQKECDLVQRILRNGLRQFMNNLLEEYLHSRLEVTGIVPTLDNTFRIDVVDRGNTESPEVDGMEEFGTFEVPEDVDTSAGEL